LPQIRGSECQPQCTRRCADRYDQRERDEQGIVAEQRVSPHCRHVGIMHRGNAKSHEDAAENELQRRRAPAAEDIKCAAGDDDRHQQRNRGGYDIVGHWYRHDEGEHANEVHRPDSASHRDRGRYQPDVTRNSPSDPHVPTEIEGGVGREGCDQYGQRDEICIVTPVRSIPEQIQLVIVHHRFGTVDRL
jgi:hypothetical protein